MKHTLYLLVIASFVLFSCSGNSESTSAPTENSAPSNAYAGNDVNMSVTDFDENSQKINAVLNNGLNQSIRGIRGVFSFMDSLGTPLTFANGNPKTSNFQKVSNPEIVSSKSSVTLQFGNKIEKGTASINVSITEVETVDGKKIQLTE